jgi:hypothetical protein
VLPARTSNGQRLVPALHAVDDRTTGGGAASDVLAVPKLPANVKPLTQRERRAIALSAAGFRNAQLLESLNVNRLGPLWVSIGTKLGVTRQPRRQAGFVFRARVHGFLDQPDPADPGPLPQEVFALVRAFALGKTVKQHALDLKVPVWDVEDIAQLTRECLNAETQPNIVYRALPQLLLRVHPPLATAGTGTAQAAASAPIVRSFSTELPGDQSAVYMARVWTRTVVTALCWNGSILQATGAISRLVDNGIRHGLPEDLAQPKRRLSVRAAITEADELLIDVSDLNPSFPDAGAAIRGEKGRGLWLLARQGSKVVWFLHHEGPGKTVRAVLSPGPVDP